MRITKEPEERKQEILDTAMRIFYEKGYEKTSITDIAKAIGVAQGLCYRYFPSKEALFDSAIDQYAEELVSQFPIQTDNKKFHDQLTLKVCEKLSKIVIKLLEQAKEKGEILINDVQTAAFFCVYGQIGILLDETYTAEEKEKRIRDFLIYTLRL